MCNLCIKTKFIYESVVNSPFSESASKSNLFLDVISQPLVKLISLAGQKREFGRTEMGAWQDRNGSLAGQKWEAWQKIIKNTPHFEFFLSFLSDFCHFWLFSSLAEKLVTAAWQNTWPPWQEEISAGRDWILAGWSCWPPIKNDPDTPMIKCLSNCKDGPE